MVHQQRRRPASLSPRLDAWVAAGLISPGQREAIARHEATEGTGAPGPAPPPRGPSLVVEALGYLGGVVMLVGALLLAGTYWADLGVAARLALLAATAAGLVGAGAALPAPATGARARLRSVLWAGAVPAAGAFFAVLAVDVLDRHDEHQLWITGGGAALLAGVLWWRRRTVLQQVALFVPTLLLAAGTAIELTAPDASAVGATVWSVALVWTVAALGGVMTPRTSGVALGVVGAVLGASTIDGDAGIALAVATAVAALVLALVAQSLPWLGVAAVMLLWTMPRAAQEWLPGRLATALTFLVTGATLVAAAVWVARRHAVPRDDA